MPVTKALKKPSWMTDKKTHLDTPWSESVVQGVMGGDLSHQVIKYYVNDCTQAGARFMTRAWSAGTHGGFDMGDVYCSQVFLGELELVLGEPATDEQKREWLHLRTMSKELNNPW